MLCDVGHTNIGASRWGATPKPTEGHPPGGGGGQKEGQPRIVIGSFSLPKLF